MVKGQEEYCISYEEGKIWHCASGSIKHQAWHRGIRLLVGAVPEAPLPKPRIIANKKLKPCFEAPICTVAIHANKHDSNLPQSK